MPDPAVPLAQPQGFPDAEAHPVRPQAAWLLAPGRWVWAPLVLLGALVVLLRLVGEQVAMPAPRFQLVAQFSLMTVGSWVVATLVARTFLATGQPGLLLLGCGALAFGASGPLAVLFGGGDANTTVTIHNLCVWIGAVLHAAGIGQRLRPVMHQRAWCVVGAVVAAYLATFAATALAVAGRTPVFFVQGAGGTAVRWLVVGSAVVLFALCAVLVARGAARSVQGTADGDSGSNGFARWYALGLAAIALGLAGILIQVATPSPSTWAAMATQWLGSIYLMLAAWSALASGSKTARLELAAAPSHPALRYGLALVFVLGATVIQLVFLRGLGERVPFTVMYPAILLAALYGGWAPALLAIVAAAVTVNVLWLAPLGELPGFDLDLWAPTVLFVAVSGFIVAVALALAKARDQLVAERIGRIAGAQVAEAETRYRTLFEQADQGACICELVWGADGKPIDYRFLDVNPAFAAMTGLRGTIVGRGAYELIPNLERHWLDRYADVALNGPARRFQQGSLEMGREFDVFAAPLQPRGQFVVLFTDITARRAAEQRRERAAAYDAYRVALGDTLRRTARATQLQSQACRLLGQLIGASRVMYADVQGDTYTIGPQYAHGAVPLQGSGHISDFGRRLAAALAAGSPVVLADVAADGSVAPAERAAFAQAQVAALIAVPLLREGRMVGIFSVHQQAPRRWTPDEAGWVEETAARTWEALERRRAQDTLDRNARRDNFGLRLLATLRPLQAPAEVQAAAAELLRDELDADRVIYYEVEPAYYLISADAARPGPGAPIARGDGTLSAGGGTARNTIAGRYPADAFGSFVRAESEAGRTVAIHNLAEHASFDAAQVQAWAALGIVAIANVPLIKNGRFIAGLAVHMAGTRAFDAEEVALAELTAEQTWAAVERARSEQALRASESVFRTLGEALPDLLWISQADGTPIYQNPAWRTYTGLSAEALQTGGWSQMIHPDDLPRLQAVWADALARPVPFEVEQRSRRHDGEYRWFLSRTVPVLADDGTLVKWVGTGTDIHDRKLRTEELAQADRRKNEFIAMLAHELRNPLAPVRSAAHTIALHATTPEQQRASAAIERQMQHMTRLIDDLIDVSRITQGRIELRLQDIDLAAVLDAAVETSRPLIDERGQHLVFEPPRQRWPMRGDATRLAQVFANLLNNAARYSDRGATIELSVVPSADPSASANEAATEADARAVAVHVRDNGIGIPGAMLERVFEPFEQLHPSGERARGGLGIGLTLVRRLVALHGGEVRAHSDGTGRGSEFVVRLPLAEQAAPAVPAEHAGAAAAAAPAPREQGVQAARQLPRPALTPAAIGAAPAVAPAIAPMAPAAPLRVLVVDDNTDATETLLMLLEFAGHTGRGASDGAEAVAAWAEFGPHCVLLDLGMSGMDGYTSARAIRAAATREGRPVPTLVATTGWGQPEHRQRAREAGFHHHLVKPIDPNELLGLLAELGPAAQPA